jgi:C4-dicarboxylate transporter/malic acid transport protein
MRSLIKNFAPSWPSVVMGTGIIPIALLFMEPLVPATKLLGIGFFILTAALFTIILVLSIARLLFAREDLMQDMRHPVAGNFFSTLPIAAMILAIDFMQVGTRMFAPGTAHEVALVLFFLGTVGIYILGLSAAAIMFGSRDVKPAHATFGWFIPPVSQLIVPVVGLDLSLAYADTALSSALFIISMASLGIGLMLFVFVGPNVYHRYLYHELPTLKMAPTVMIGLAPTAILTIILVKLAGVAVAPGSPWIAPAFPATARILTVVGWGFSVWWFALATILVARHFKMAAMDFALSWWALSFPIGALAVATGALNKLYRLPFFAWAEAGLTIVLLVIWVFVVYGTVRIVANGSAFEKRD